jgi:hypothetical protein
MRLFLLNFTLKLKNLSCTMAKYSSRLLSSQFRILLLPIFILISFLNLSISLIVFLIILIVELYTDIKEINLKRRLIIIYWLIVFLLIILCSASIILYIVFQKILYIRLIFLWLIMFCICIARLELIADRHKIVLPTHILPPPSHY